MNLERLKSQLRNDEGESLTLYKCTSNKFTIGIGRNIEDNGISKDESELMFENDVGNVVKELVPGLNKRYMIDFSSLSDIRQEVLLNMAFQMGVPRLLKFENTFKYLKACVYYSASQEMLDSSWAKQTPNRAYRLSYAMQNDKFMKGGKI